jgi:hypothetical protein
MIVVRWRSSSLPPLRIGTNVVIDNLIILATCGGTLVVAIRAILMERREVARRAAAQPRTRR